MDFFNGLAKGLSARSTTSAVGGLYAPGRSKEYDYNETDSIPSEMGSYRFIDKNRQIVYIGISKDVRSRVKEHKRKGVKFLFGEKVAVQIAISGDKNEIYEKMRQHEQMKVNQHNPARNERRGGGGRTPNLDVD